MICPGCGTATPEGARRCNLCGAALRRDCPACAGELPPAASYCPYCGGRVAANGGAAGSPPPARGERRRATVLFSDLWGYTALAESLDPEEVADVMNRLKDVATRVIELFGGTVNQFVGDQVMALFGIPVAREDAPLRAVRAAFELHRAVRALGGELAPRIGHPLWLHSAVNSGLVISQRRDARDGMYGVIGDVINTGARLLLVSGEDEIVVGPETRRAIEPFFDGEALGAVALRGKTLPVPAWRVLRPRHESRFEAARRRGLSAFRGRRRELETLAGALREARAGHASLVVVEGEPGVGKSRLFHEFEAGLERSGAAADLRILRGRCPAFGAVAPFRAFLEVVREGLAIATGRDGAGLSEPGAVPTTDPELALHLPVYLHLLSIRSERHPLPRALQGDALREAVLAAIAALVRWLARTSPVLLVLEDWHWADEASDRALRHLVHELAGEPLLVLVNRRPSQRPRGDELAPLEIRLAPLDARDTEDFVASLLGPRATSELASRVHRRTEGNPLFIEELCRALADRSDADAFAPGPAGPWAFDVPASIAAILRASLDQLEPATAEVLRIASVLGEDFQASVLGRLVPAPERLEARLAALRDADLLRPLEAAPEPSFRFRHALVRDAAYDGLLLRRRRELHGAAAHALEAHAGDGDLDTVCEQLAHHYAESDEAERALHYLDRSGDKAVATGAMILGLEHYRRAVAALDSLEATEARLRRRIDLSLKLANAAIYRPSLESVRTIARSHADAERLGDLIGVVRTLYWMGWIEHALGRWSEARPHFERCAQLARTIGDEKLLAQLSSNMGQAFFYAGDYGRAAEHLEAAIETRGRLDGGKHHAPVIAYSLGYLALMDGEIGHSERAEARVREAFVLGQGGGAQLEGALSCFLAVVQMFRGDWAASRATALRLAPLAQRIGSTFMLGVSRNTGGFSAYRLGEREEGLRLLRESVRDLERSEVRMQISLNYACLAEALALEGASGEAETFGRKALARAEAADRLGEAQAHRALALAALARPAPDLALAERRFAASIAAAEAKGSLRDVAITRLAALEHLARARGELPKRIELERARDELAALGLAYHRERSEALLAGL